ncbi:hypothetical protein B7494_g3173 [Chlorociboria aeruginascens]|nr:hypothetical protein B7494_g3173 [Chlorociboria aeruginascens]
MEELFGCWREAERCRRVATELVRIRNALNLESFEDISAVLNEIESASRLLRDLHDLFPIYRSRVHFVIYYLSVILPCLCKTLRDMLIYVDNSALVPRAQWSLMYERMGEQGGMPLAARSPLYDPTSLELLRIRVLRLRQLRGIPDTKKMESLLVPLARLAPQVPVQPHLAPVQPRAVEIERRHWAEKIFDEQPHSTTGLRHRRSSTCFGPMMNEARLGIPPGSTVLFKLQGFPQPDPFPPPTLMIVDPSIEIGYLLPSTCMALILLNCYADGPIQIPILNTPASELTNSASKEEDPHYSYVAGVTTKRMPLYGLLFSSSHGNKITVSLVKENYSRLTYTCGSPDWMVRKGRHRIWLKGLHPYVFCKEYKKRHQQKRHGEFELDFADEAATDAFVEVFALDSDGIDTLDGDRAVTAGDGAAGGGGG